MGVQGNKIADVRTKRVLDGTRGRYEIVMQRIQYGGENVVNLDMELVFTPTADESKRIREANEKATDKYNAEKQRLVQKAYMEAVRDRIKDASQIKSRPSWDLREEERTVVYRKLIERLMLDSWKLPDNAANRRLSHVRAEIVRSIFDVDSMLYFVAPEWWMPRRRTGRLDLNITCSTNPSPCRQRHREMGREAAGQLPYYGRVVTCAAGQLSRLAAPTRRRQSAQRLLERAVGEGRHSDPSGTRNGGAQLAARHRRS